MMVSLTWSAVNGFVLKVIELRIDCIAIAFGLQSLTNILSAEESMYYCGIETTIEPG
jgi:hypothetical protein